MAFANLKEGACHITAATPNRLSGRLPRAYLSENYDCITVDGVRIKFGDGWGLVRSSNTQPVIVCRFEANTPERRDEIMDIVLTKLSEFGELIIGGH